MAGFYGEFLDTVGIEYEGIGLDRETVGQCITRMTRDYNQNTRVNVVHDASTEFNASYVRTNAGIVLVSNHTKEMSDILGRQIQGVRTMGYELVTYPLHVPELGKLLYPMVASLVNNGDFVSDRASTHFHIGFANNLVFLQSLLEISLMVDPVLYRLGGMGRTFRGRTNQCAYARPLLHSAAVNVVTRNPEKRYAKVINPLAALSAKTIEEFWASFGVEYKLGGGSSKYHPSRYGGINFFSVPQHGTIEFRHCNQTHDVFMIIAVAKLVRGFTELSTCITEKELEGLSVVPSHVEISMGDATEILRKLLGLCRSHKIKNLPDDYEMEAILQTIEKSHFEEISELPVLTHIRDNVNTIPLELAQSGKLQFFREVLPPNAVDIHNIVYRSIFDGVILENPLPQVHQEADVVDWDETGDGENDSDFDEEDGD